MNNIKDIMNLTGIFNTFFFYICCPFNGLHFILVCKLKGILKLFAIFQLIYDF